MAWACNRCQKCEIGFSRTNDSAIYHLPWGRLKEYCGTQLAEFVVLYSSIKMAADLPRVTRRGSTHFNHPRRAHRLGNLEDAARRLNRSLLTTRSQALRNGRAFRKHLFVHYL